MPRLCEFVYTEYPREHNGVANFCQKGKKRRHGSSNSGMAPACVCVLCTIAHDCLAKYYIPPARTYKWSASARLGPRLFIM